MSETKQPGRPMSKVNQGRLSRIEALEVGAHTSIANVEMTDLRGLRSLLTRRGLKVSMVKTTKGVKITRLAD
jgi:hypothetical protein